MTLPQLGPDASPSELVAALREHGAALWRDPALPAARCEELLAAARAFFALPSATKQALAIERSPHQRGYSVAHNGRDWREQLHFANERPPRRGPAHAALAGPNLWPPDATWRATMLAHLDATTQIAQRIATWLARGLGVPDAAFVSAEPYVVMKLIHYHAQPDAARQRPGVAPHVDFSWLTLTLQDDVGGLQVASPDGRWIDVPCVAGALLLHVGELLQFATAGRLRATPHRVVNPSTARGRCSIPVFWSPGLDDVVQPLLPPLTESFAPGLPEHVHRVLELDGAASSAPEPFTFGAAEWRRKGENVWCAQCCADR